MYYIYFGVCKFSCGATGDHGVHSYWKQHGVIFHEINALLTSQSSKHGGDQFHWNILSAHSLWWFRG